MIAVTGGIGAGKSTALEAFAARGASVLDTDSVVHRLLEQDEVRHTVSRSLGIGGLEPGRAGRRRLAERVFSPTAGPGDLEALQEVLFPLVEREVSAWAERESASGARALVVEVPMLFEAGMEGLFDLILLVKAPERLRQRRLRGEMEADEFQRRAGRQMPAREREGRCHMVYDNSGTAAELKRFVWRLLDDVEAPGG
jgi:dephospho-CoA kinase